MGCNIAGCSEETVEQFCDRHRCKGLTAKGKQCKSSMNCGIVHASYMGDLVLNNMLVLHCFKCNTEFSAERGTEAAIKMAEAYTKARGICKKCRNA